MRKRSMGAAVLLLSAGLMVAPSPATATVPPPGDATGRYIVVLDDGADARGVASEHARAQGARVERVYGHALDGYAATMSPEAAARIGRDPRVAHVEPDQVVRAIHHAEVPSGIDRIATPDQQHAVPAHLTIDGKDDLRVDTGVAIIDSGIDHTHPDLNVVAGTDCTGGGTLGSTCVDGLAGDGNGHGTHVAGSVAALDNGAGVVGVAPGARLHAVKVLSDSGSGYTSWIIAGIDWVTAHRASISVANMSLGCECTSAAQDKAISSSVAAGIVYAVAAGNSDKDAATFSPANHPDVITVSALADFNGVSGGGAPATCRADRDDTLADFSNFGSSVEIAAPGTCIRSTWPGGGYNTISGTSMASPHAAGAAALLTSKTKPTDRDTALHVRSMLVITGNTGWTDDSGDGTREPLLDVSNANHFSPSTVSTGGGGGGTDPAPTAVTASFSYSCSKATCSFDGTTSTGATGFSWDFGGSGVGNGQQVTHTFSTTGSYAVTLTVAGGGSSDTETKTVTCSKKGKNLVCG